MLSSGRAPGAGFYWTGETARRDDDSSARRLTGHSTPRTMMRALVVLALAAAAAAGAGTDSVNLGAGHKTTRLI